MRHGSDKTLQVEYANQFYRSAHKFEQICRHRLRRQNVGYSNFSQPQSHLSFCVLLQYLVERRRVVTQLGKLDRSEERFSRNAETDLVCRLLLEKKKKLIDIYYFSFLMIPLPPTSTLFPYTTLFDLSKRA